MTDTIEAWLEGGPAHGQTIRVDHTVTHDIIQGAWYARRPPDQDIVENGYRPEMGSAYRTRTYAAYFDHTDHEPYAHLGAHNTPHDTFACERCLALADIAEGLQG